MKVLYNNLYTHFVFTTKGRLLTKYIINQPIHHKKQTFAEEYEQFMKFYQQTLLPKKSGNQGG